MNTVKCPYCGKVSRYWRCEKCHAMIPQTTPVNQGNKKTDQRETKRDEKKGGN